MVEKIGQKEISGKKCFVYKVSTEQSPVFMCVDALTREASEWYVVIVDSHKFYEAWEKKTIEHCVIMENELERYAEAKDGFSRGIENPVPLANISYLDKISIDDGIARTKWLIKNGAPCFPIVCDEQSLENCKRLIYNNLEIETVADLLVEK